MYAFLPGLYIAALLHALFLILITLRNKTGRPSSIYFSMLLILMMVKLWNVSLEVYEFPEELKFFNYNIPIFGLGFFWSPLLYLYIYQKVGPEKNGVKFGIKHLIFPVVLSAFGSYFRIWELLPYPMLSIVFFSYAASYIFVSFRVLQNYRKLIKDRFSYVDDINLNWLSRLLSIYAILFFFYSVPSILRFTGLSVSSNYSGLMVLLETCTIFLIGYFSLQQPEILFQKMQIKEKIIKKYDNSALDEELSKTLSKDLLLFMEKNHPYKKNDLTLGELSDLTSLSQHHLSQVINEQMGCNFYEFINRYRVDYATELMKNNDQSNITKLAFEAGFNNRVSFTKAFKKKIGQNPSQYIKNLSK